MRISARLSTAMTAMTAMSALAAREVNGLI